MTDVNIAKLATLISPPAQPDRFDGNTLNCAYGPTLEVPRDYSDFMAIYGPGWFTEDGMPSVEVLDICVAPHNDFIQKLLKNASDAHRFNPGKFPDVYPTIPGLLPWGTWDQGYTLFWWVDGAADSWRVAVDARAKMQWYDCSFGEYLLGAVARHSNRKFETYLMPERVKHIGYCPASRQVECFGPKPKP